MTKSGLLVAAIVGLLAAGGATALLTWAAASQPIDLLVFALDILAAGLAGRVILGPVRVHRYFGLGVVVLSAIAAGVLTSAGTTYLIHIAIEIGAVDYTLTGAIIVGLVLGFAAYLLAAVVYGFAARRQGIPTGSRVGLLLLLLLAVIPVLNVLGLIALAIATARRKPVTRAQPAVSE